MPVQFLTGEQRASYGRFAGPPAPEQLARYFHLDDADRKEIGRRRGPANRLGFAAQLGTVRFLVTFLPVPREVPADVAAFLGRQLGIPAAALEEYRDEQVWWRHAREIRTIYGYRDFGSQPEGYRLTRWLFARAWLSSERPSVLCDLATAWMAERKILLPGISVLERLVARVRDRASARLWKLLFRAATPEFRNRLEALLLVPAGARQTPLDRLRNEPTRGSAPALREALERWLELQALGAGSLDLSHIPPAKLESLARYAGKTWAQNIARMPEERRIATLVAFARFYETAALDDAIDILDGLLFERLKKARQGRDVERLDSLPDLDQAALILCSACGVLLDQGCQDADVRPKVFDEIPRQLLQQAFDRVALLARPTEEHINERLTQSYRSIRKFLPLMLRMVPFQATAPGAPVLRALKFLKAIEGETAPDMTKAPLEGMSQAWQKLILGPGGRAVDRGAYTLYALQRLHDALRRRDVFVQGANRWGDPREKLLRGPEWEGIRAQVLRTLGREREPEPELRRLRQELDEAYLRASANFRSNEDLRLYREAGVDFVGLSRLDRIEEPDSLLLLRHQVKALLPRVDLPEVLLEIHARTGFVDEFTHISEGSGRVADLPVSVCAVLLAEACNIGLDPLVRQGTPALARARLSWVMQNYLRADTLVRANARLVEAQSRIPLATRWGGGEVATADGVRFVVPVKTIHAGPNPRYFGVGRGITYYNFTSDQFTGFHSIIIPGTLRDSLVLLDGLLEQQTLLEPREVMTDTAGASDLVFGLFWLLGYQFSPRLADLGKVRFWRFDFSQNYGVLNCLGRHIVREDLITSQWDEMLRVAGSLKLGRVSASELTRSLLRSTRPTTLARGITELGKLAKTIHLLNYIDSEAYRRRILAALNRNESRNKWARHLCHGQRGQIRKRYRTGQEDQLNALGLVLNAVILWNTVYMDAALEHLRSDGRPTADEDIARLSPLEHRNVNVLGRYTFALPENIARGELRQLGAGETEELLLDALM